MTITALVRGGQLVVDEPADLPKGPELELLPLDAGDWLDEAARRAAALTKPSGSLFTTAHTRSIASLTSSVTCLLNTK